MVSAVRLLRCTAGGSKDIWEKDAPEQDRELIVRLLDLKSSWSRIVAVLTVVLSFTTLSVAANTE